MINFASLFNQFRMNNSSIGDLIDSPGITLDRLLDQESFTNQFKSGNSKVQQFMKYDKFETLVKYVTEVGPPQDRKRSFKFPLSACDLLSSDSNITLDFFFGQNPIILREQVPNEPQVAKQKQNAQAPTEQKDSKQEATTGQQNKSTQKSQRKSSQQIHLEGESNTSSQHIQQQEKAEHDTKSVEATPKTRIVQKEVQPLRYELFSYYKGEVNYPLAGYVSKIFAAFFIKKPVAVAKFLLQPERFKQILNHIESRSVGQLILKMLTHESNQLMQQRKYAFEQLLQKVSKSDQVYVISNLATAICQIIQKIALGVKNNNENSIQLSKLYFNPAIITQIISNVMSDEENVSVYNAPILQTYLLNVPLLIPEKSQISQDLKSLLQLFVKKTLQKIRVRRQQRPKLGFGRMKIIQIISFVLKQNILNAKQLVAAETDFFSILLNLCTNYQYNNVLHNEVVKIIEIALNEAQGSVFLQSLLKDDVFLKFLVNQAAEDQKIRAGSGSQKARKGYIGHIVSLCRKIKELSAKNPALGRLLQRKQFVKVLQTLVDKQVFEYNKNLAGYAMKRSTKHPILFAKQQIIQEHLKFLAASPAPVFQLEPQPINIQHPDLVQAEKIQIQAQARELAEQQLKKQQKKAEIQIEVQDYNPRFFQYHIQYNIDELMNQL